jgi:hypothetical protein
LLYTIYKTTNIQNGKFYIGKHQTKNLDDGYMGSGNLLKRAIAKYGKDSFVKEVLFIFDNEEDMNAKEKELVTEEFVKSDDNYNICEGGQGGFSYLNNNFWDDQKRQIHNDKVSGVKKYTFEQRSFYAKQNVKNRIGIHAPDYVRPSNMMGTFKGKSHSEAAKRKIGQANSIHQVGKNNSQYGTMWITDGSSNKKIKKEELDNWIKKGYYKGRINLSPS